jgi:RimJ/RimL family protein N-acetyltransferase
MQALGGVTSAGQASAWLEAHLAHWSRHGYGRFFVTRGEAFVGLVGLSRNDFDAGMVPGVEIAWRLSFDGWGKGYATEAARAVMRDGFERLGLDEIIAVTTPGNSRSLRVMERLGMVHAPGDTFDPPRLPEGDSLRLHVVYRLRRNTEGRRSA